MHMENSNRESIVDSFTERRHAVTQLPSKFGFPVVLLEQVVIILPLLHSFLAELEMSRYLVHVFLVLSIPLSNLDFIDRCVGAHGQTDTARRKMRNGA